MARTIQVIGLKQAIKDIEGYVYKTRKGLLGAVAHTSHNIRDDAKKLAAVDLAEMKGQIGSTLIEKRDNSITGDVLSAASYSAYVEFGTKPHRPPYKALEGWAGRHGIPTGAVVNKIAKFGTPAQPFMTPAAMKNKQKFINEVMNVLRTP